MTDFTPQFEDLPNAPIREALASEARQDCEQPLSYRAQGIHERFQALAEEWHEATDDLSGTAVFMHPAYQQIIGMGPVVLPLLFRDLAKTESH